MRVPFLDVRAGYTELRAELQAALDRVAESGQYILGSEVEAFESAFADYVGTRHCVGVGSGLAALYLTLKAVGIGGGDEVIVPANGFIGTWLAVSHAGASPVPVEPDEATYNMDPGRVEEAVTPRTKALLPVHLYGQPADVGPMLDIARRRGLFVLEDAAQAHGARALGRRVGSLGDAGAWSFYPGKNLGALGDGGAVTTDDGDLADRLRMLRDYGSKVKNVHEVRGFNSRLDTLQAAVLSVKLRHLDEWNKRRAAVAASYREALGDCGCLLPYVAEGVDPSWHLFVVQVPDRDALVGHLSAAGIATGVHYPLPPHLQAAYADLGLASGSLPISEGIHSRVLSLPIGPHLEEPAVRLVVEAVRSFGG